MRRRAGPGQPSESTVRKPKLYAVYVAYGGTSYSKALFHGAYASCLRWRSEQERPPRGSRLVVAPSHLMNR